MLGCGDTQVLNRFAKALLSVAVLTALGAAALAQDPPKTKQVKDQGEFDLFTEVGKTTDANKRLSLLNTWKEKYPNTDFKEERAKYFAVTYQQLGQGAKMAEAAKEILAINPKEVNALFWLTALTLTLPATPDTLGTGEKSAQGLIDAQKPPEVKDEDWKKMKAGMDVSAHNTLAFIALQKKDPETAEKEYVKSLTANPNQADISYALGNAILAQKKPERQSEVLFHWARAASLKGPGALPADKLKTIEAFFVKQYTAFHGDDAAGMAELRQLATANPMPPAGFVIKNKNEIAAEKQEKANKENPAGALWNTIKEQLTAANGEQYFESSVKGAALPGGANNVTKFTAKLISQKPALKPKTLVVSISGDTPEVTLNLEGFVLPGKAEPGTELKFEGVASAFTKEPFMLTFDVDSKDKIQGWPAQAAAPVTKKAPIRRKKQ
jgi:tetratricopeptide (TPR) repeat protein